MGLYSLAKQTLPKVDWRIRIVALLQLFDLEVKLINALGTQFDS